MGKILGLVPHKFKKKTFFKQIVYCVYNTINKVHVHLYFRKHEFQLVKQFNTLS